MKSSEEGFTLTEAMVSILITGLMIVILLRGDQGVYYERAAKEIELSQRMRNACAEAVQLYTAERQHTEIIKDQMTEENGFVITIRLREEDVRNGRLLIIQAEGYIKAGRDNEKIIRREFEERYLL